MISRKGTSLLEHPLLKEYLKTYDAVVGFKEGMSKMFLDKDQLHRGGLVNTENDILSAGVQYWFKSKQAACPVGGSGIETRRTGLGLTVVGDALTPAREHGQTFQEADMMSAHQMTSDLETLTFDHSQKVMPQIEELTQNVAYVLDELVNLTNNILVYDREPPVSSLHLLSREPTQKSFHAVGESALSFSNPIPVAPPATLQDVTRGGSRASSQRSGGGGKGEVKGRLKQQLEDNGKQHQEQLQRNTVVMMEMQDTINGLQRELSALGKTAKQSKSRLSSARGSAVHHKSPSPETSVMFTRLDSERNAKIMKKAVMDEKLNAEKYKEAVAKMDEYVSLPAQRLAHLVRKYMHHKRMRAIEEKVKNSSSVNEEVFEVLDKMEDLQNRTNGCTDSFFLSRDVKPGGHPGKLSRPVRTQHRIGTGNPRHATPTNDGASSFVPAPTPASNYRLVRHERHFLQQQQQQQQQVVSGGSGCRFCWCMFCGEDGGQVLSS
ncbi:centrosome-associated protein CEP250-like isoform X1 [Elysia marginata]|uniref:Centrosome-associated protein CEP250-like isoform X1 n=1 Tax=Elysia marginata TaxID=1093978 RepID=A0AAV4F5R6_9GAST|nr:centrosome-associated protein CEP250-like isoform X1 [Elysia marginata]